MITPKDMKHGTIHETNHGSLEVLKYIKSAKVLVRFVATGYEDEVSAVSIRNGSARDPFKPSVAGVGFIGSKNNRANLGFSSHTRYDCWRNMLVRCYDENVRSQYPTYAGCTVCDEWHNFQNFAAWYDEQAKDRTVKYDIDKDMLSNGAKIYSPDTCVMVPRWLNNFLIRKSSYINSALVGVSFDHVRGKFRASASDGGQTKYLGLFNSEVEAHKAWVKHKLSVLKKRKREIDSINTNLYPSIVRDIRAIIGKTA